VDGICEATGDEIAAVRAIVAPHTGFTNLYNAFRNSSLAWIEANEQVIHDALEQAFVFQADNVRLGVAQLVDGLSAVDRGDGTGMPAANFLTPLVFSMDPENRFPIVNGRDYVQTLLRRLSVANRSLESKVRAMISLIGRPGLEDAAALDQVRSGFEPVTDRERHRIVQPASEDSKEARTLPFKDESDYEVLIAQSRVPAKREHNRLTNALLVVADTRGVVVTEGVDDKCLYDACLIGWDKDGDVLVEVKSSSELAAVRMAIGQLLDYQRRFDRKSRPVLALLLPAKPEDDVAQLLHSVGIGLMYFDDEELMENWPSVLRR
jgi:hypothetical protein